MEPPLRLQMQAFDLNGKLVLIIEVPEVDPGQKPCYYKPAGLHGGAYVRVGDGDRRMTDYEIYSLMSSRGPVNDDRRAVPGASLDDLDHDAVSQYLVRLFPDRIEIQSPGGLYGQVSADRLGEPGLQSTRNPLLARFLEGLGPMENRGSGIVTMLRSLRLAYLEPPRFEDQRTSFRVTFFGRTMLDQETLDWLSRFAGYTDLDDRQRYGLAYLHHRGQLANRDYQLLNAVDPRTASRDLRALVSAGLVESVGTRGGTHYRLAQPHVVSEARAAFSIDASPRRLRPAQQAVLAIIAESGPIGTAEAASRLDLGRSTANYQVRRLLDAGLIEPTEARPQSGRQAYLVTAAGARLVPRHD